MWEPRGLPLRRKVLANLSTPIQGAHLRKEAVVLKSPLILVTPILGLHTDFDQLENEATPKFTLVATSESSFFSFLAGSNSS